MHVLITNNALGQLAGSELFVYDLARELQRRGHKVTAFTLRPGLVAERLRDCGVATTSDLTTVEDVDVIHAHHPLEMRLAAARFPLVPLIYVSHGITHPLERPGSCLGTVTRFVAICEEVKEYLVTRDGIPPGLVDVVPNFVDTERFSRQQPIPARPRRVLVVSNHYGGGGTKETIEQACKIAGDLELEVIGAGTQSVWNVEDYLERADVVITLGRGALQAMAMGRATVIYDYRGGDGLVTPDNYRQLAAVNFSGRAFSLQLTPDELAPELVSYDMLAVEDLMLKVREEHSLKVAADRFLDLYVRAIAEFRCAWPEDSHLQRVTTVLGEFADYASGLKDTANSIAEVGRLSLLLSERDGEISRLYRERELSRLALHAAEPQADYPTSTEGQQKGAARDTDSPVTPLGGEASSFERTSRQDVDSRVRKLVNSFGRFIRRQKPG